MLYPKREQLLNGRRMFVHEAEELSSGGPSFGGVFNMLLMANGEYQLRPNIKDFVALI